MTQPTGKNSVKTLYSKLKTPRRQSTLHRERLIRVFDDIQHKKLVTVIAGAGYGKTTLVVDALNRLDAEPVWYRMDAQDSDFFVFVSYLYAAVHHHFPDTSKKENKPFLLKHSVKKMADVLLAWLAFVEKKIAVPTVIVLDDFHLISDNTRINDAIEFILGRLPDHIHLIIIGRQNLSIRISALRAGEQLIEINEQDLSFTAGEVRHLFTDTCQLTDVNADDIHSLTGGWAASLVLLRYAFQKKTKVSIAETLKSFIQTPNYIFSYLKETFFDTQPDHIQTFMMKAALLPEIDTRQCRRIFDVDNAGDFLKQMIDDHLLIFPMDESGTLFYLHHLFRDFLIAQLNKRLSRQDISELHCRIAHETQDDDIFLALHHFIEGQAFDEAIQLIETHEIKFLIQGKINFLGQCLKKIPDKIIEANPKLLLAQAKLVSHFGDPQKALSLITKAHLLFKKQGAKDEMVTCLVELGTQYYYTGHVKEAKLLMEQVLDDVDTQSITYAIVMTFLTFLSSVLGEFDIAESYYEKAMETIDGYPDFERKASRVLVNTSLTHILFFKGEFENSYSLSQKLLKKIHALKIDPCLPLIYYQLSADCCFLGEFEDGCMYAQKGIESCEKMALSDSRKGWNYIAWAQNCIELKKFDRASELIDKGIELFEDPGNRWGLANAWESRHKIEFLQGNIKKARQTLTNALDLIQGHGLNITRGILENGLARLMIHQKDWERALCCLEHSRSKLHDALFHLFDNHLLTVTALARLNLFQEAAGHLDTALSISQEQDYSRFLKKEEPRIRRLFNDHPETFSPLYEKHKIVLEPLLEKKINVPILKISLLGAFKAEVGENRKPGGPFKSASALMLLKYLATHRQRGFIHKDEFIELLWPEEDPLKTGSRFNMAMSALRKTLEPDLPPKAASSYIERKKDAYRFYNDDRIAIDAERFAKTASLALKTIADPAEKRRLLFKAESIYVGPFLEEDRYQDWCMEKRDHYAGMLGRVLNAIADCYETKNDIKNTIVYTRKRLNLDPCSEKAFKNLMRLYCQAADSLKVTQTFQEYIKMTHEMDLPVNPEIEKFYRRLIQSQ